MFRQFNRFINELFEKYLWFKSKSYNMKLKTIESYKIQRRFHQIVSIRKRLVFIFNSEIIMLDLNPSSSGTFWTRSKSIKFNIGSIKRVQLRNMITTRVKAEEMSYNVCAAYLCNAFRPTPSRIPADKNIWNFLACYCIGHCCKCLAARIRRCLNTKTKKTVKT